MYLGPDSLGNIEYTELALHTPSKSTQYLYFKQNYIKITDEGIEFEEIKNLNGQVWRDSIIDFVPSKTELLINEVHQINTDDIKENEELANYKGEYTLDFSKDGENCQFLNFLSVTVPMSGR